METNSGVQLSSNTPPHVAIAMDSIPGSLYALPEYGSSGRRSVDDGSRHEPFPNSPVAGRRSQDSRYGESAHLSSPPARTSHDGGRGSGHLMSPPGSSSHRAHWHGTERDAGGSGRLGGSGRIRSSRGGDGGGSNHAAAAAAAGAAADAEAVGCAADGGAAGGSLHGGVDHGVLGDVEVPGVTDAEEHVVHVQQPHHPEDGGSLLGPLLVLADDGAKMLPLLKQHTMGRRVPAAAGKAKVTGANAALLHNYNWLKIDMNGDSCAVQGDLYKVAHKHGLQTRDLRLLDPALSSHYPSAILDREGAIVVNLEFIKAIITESFVIVVNPEDEQVAVFVADLKAKLSAPKPIPQTWSAGMLPGEVAVARTAMLDLPFELKALEVCLDTMSAFLERTTGSLEADAYPALDALIGRVNEINLEKVRRIKNRMVRLMTRVETVHAVLDKFLKDDDDMHRLQLSANARGPSADGGGALGGSGNGMDGVNNGLGSRHTSLQAPPWAHAASGRFTLGMPPGTLGLPDSRNGGNGPFMSVAEDVHGGAHAGGESGDTADSGLASSAAAAVGDAVNGSSRYPARAQITPREGEGGGEGGGSSSFWAAAPGGGSGSGHIGRHSRHSQFARALMGAGSGGAVAGAPLTSLGSGGEPGMTALGTPQTSLGFAPYPFSPQDGRHSGMSRGTRSRHGGVAGGSFTTIENAEDEEEVEQVEMLLEAYFMPIHNTFNRLQTLHEYIKDTEDLVNIDLDQRRNQLITITVVVSALTAAISITSAAAGIFGMNLDNTIWLQPKGGVFQLVCLTSSIIPMGLFFLFVGWLWKLELLL